VRTGVLDEKSAAMHALGVYAHYCPLGFSSHIPPALELASRGVAYFHEDVRAQVGGAGASRSHQAWWLDRGAD
jgi:hypothetical protein